MPREGEIIKTRWLVHGGTAHVLYETEEGHSKTLCGKLLRGGEIKLATVKATQGKCRACIERVRVRNRVIHD
jgi:hypothetical protein